MNDITKSTDPAHPIVKTTLEKDEWNKPYGNVKSEGGLSKREWYAGLAMQGMIGDQTYVQPNRCEEVAQLSIKLADALIAELNK